MWKLILLDGRLSRLSLLRQQLNAMEGLPMEIRGSFTSVREMLASRGAQSCDMLITSLSVRDTDAFGLLERLKALPAPRRPRVMVLLPALRPGLESQLYAAGAYYCMPQPADAGEIFRRAAQLLCRDRVLPTPGEGQIRAYLRRNGLMSEDVGGRYLVLAVEVLLFHQMDCKLVSAVYQEVGRKENVRPAAVESGIRRTVQHLAQEQPEKMRPYMDERGNVSNGRFLRRLAMQIAKEEWRTNGGTYAPGKIAERAEPE